MYFWRDSYLVSPQLQSKRKTKKKDWTKTESEKTWNSWIVVRKTFLICRQDLNLILSTITSLHVTYNKNVFALTAVKTKHSSTNLELNSSWRFSIYIFRILNCKRNYLFSYDLILVTYIAIPQNIPLILLSYNFLLL